jgi:CTP synthase (UTP-ammonia lyase)
MTTIGIIGEHDPGNETHVATDDALGHAAAALGIALRFFVATLFVPQARSTATEPHPLVTEFVAAAQATDER